MKPNPDAAIQIAANALPKKGRVIRVILFTGLAWYWLASNRKLLIGQGCIVDPASCTPDKVWAIDRWAIHAADRQIDFWSFVTQDLAAAFALASVCIFVYFRSRQWIVPTLYGLVLVAATGLNGLLTEITRILVQRPRPFVYNDPAQMGLDPAHYTSFYSGHTSFTASVGMCSFLILQQIGASRTVLRRYAIVASGLVLATATFRVLAGRHFPTDTLGGMVCGAMAGWLVYQYTCSETRFR